MNDLSKTKAQLIDELHTLRGRVASLETMELEYEQIKQALKENEQRFHSIFKYSNDAIFIIDPVQDEILDVNPKACAMLDYTREELLSVPVSVIHPNEVSKYKAFIQTVSERGHSWTDELTCLTKTKKVLSAEISASVVELSGRACIVALIRNITRRKQAAEKLQSSEERFRNVSEGSVQGILVHQDTKPVFINQAFANILGYESPDEIINAGTIVPLIAPHDQKRLLGYYQARIKGEPSPSQYEYEALCKDGTIAVLQNNVSVIDWQGAPAVLSTIIDITERKRIEEALYFVAQRGWTLDGETFFQSLVQYLAKTLKVDYAFVGKLTEDSNSICTVALYAQGKIVDNIEYALKDTPCENVVGKNLCSYPENVQQQFPQDHVLVEMDVESYVGIPLWDSKGNPIGLIVVLGCTPLTSTSLIESILQVVAVRAAHELERQQIEQAIKASEAHYRSLFEGSPISLWEEDWSQVKHFVDALKAKGVSDFQTYFAQHPDTLKRYVESVKVVDVNQATLTLYKANNKEDLLGELGKIFGEEAFDTPPYALLSLIEGKKPYEYERVNQTLTGEKLYVLMRMVVVPGYEDTWSKILVAIDDITKRKQFEAKLLESEKNLAKAQEIAHLGSWDWDVLTNKIRWSDEMYRIYGLDPNTEPTNEQVAQLIHPDDLEIFEKALKATIERQTIPDFIEYRIIKPDGQTRFIHSRAESIYAKDGQLIRMFGIAQDITERKQAEEALRQSEAALAKAQQIAHLGSYAWNIKTGQVYWSDEMKAILGLPPDQEPSLELFLSLIHPDDYDHITKLTDQSREENRPFNFEYRIVRPDGTIRYVHDQAEVTKDETGKPARMFGTSLDITERKVAEAEVHRRNRELTLLNQIIAVSTVNLEIESVLEIACRELAIAFDTPRATATLFNKEKTQGKIVAKYRNPENQPDFDDVISLKDDALAPHLLNHKTPLVINNRAESSNYTLADHTGVVSLIIIPLIVKDEVVGTLSVSDTNPRNFSGEDMNLVWRVAEQVAALLARIRLAETQHLLTTAIEQSAESIVITDTQGCILYVNPTFERVAGYTAAEVLGQNPRFLKSGKHDRTFYKNLWNTISSGQVWQGQFSNRKKDGTLYTEQASITPVRDNNGNIINYVAVKRDITRELQLEEQYQQAQKMEAIGRLAGGVAHDFNNLLTAIMGYVGLMQAELDPDDPIFNDLQGIQNTAQRAASLTRQLLTFARRQIVEPQALYLNDIIVNLEKMLRRLIGEDIELVIRPALDLGQIKADPGQIEQVIVNLVINACDAMPGGGKLIIETANVFLDKDYAQQYTEIHVGHYVLLTVSDTGQGMPNEVKTHIFEPFFTTKEQGKGTGLGLAICFGIVKQSRGHILVYSEEAQGTTFKVYFPRIDETTTSKAGRRLVGELPSGTETILLVEDEASVRELAVRILRDQGYEVLEATNGQEALRLIQEQPETKIHLLLTDVVMPHIGGKVLADELAAIRPEIKIMFISGYTDNAIVHEGILDTGVIFLQKPFSPALLAQKVRQVLDS